MADDMQGECSVQPLTISVAVEEQSATAVATAIAQPHAGSRAVEPASLVLQSPPPSSPPLPMRSPLRPRRLRTSSSSPAAAQSFIIDANGDSGSSNHGSLFAADSSGMPSPLPTARPESVISIDGLLEALAMSDPPMNSSATTSSSISAKSSVSFADVDEHQVASSSSLSSSSLPAATKPTSKRHHVLLELLESERAYASDLALIRDIHIPLALGQPPPFHTVPQPGTPIAPVESISPPPPPLSASTSSSFLRTLSLASDKSGQSNTTPTTTTPATPAEPSSSPSLNTTPMMPEDVKIIFSNVQELAVFADRFADKLELALGSTIPGGNGQDSVGALFLEIIPSLQPPYQHYITKHATALDHLQSHIQNPTPALTAYLNQTRDLAASLSHAWDLPSLLIKPVQRLLKYPLLLAAIIAETSDDHPDKERLIRAKERIEQVAREVNEGRRRREVVRDVLQHREGGGHGRGTKPPAAVLAANLARVKSIRAAAKGENGGNGKNGSGNANGDAHEDSNAKHEEAAAVALMEHDVRRASVFMHELAKHTMEWARTVLRLSESLRVWAISFARVIGLSISGLEVPAGGSGGGQTVPEADDTGVKSDAFDAFMLVVDEELLPLSRELQKALKDRWLFALARLVNSTRAPLQLIDAMKALEPLHHALLNTSFSAKQRPSPALLEASQSYVALRGQLFVELPMYLELLDRGMVGSVLALADIQAQWWDSIRDKWFTLWEALKVDGEANAGADETLRVWWERWEEFMEAADKLFITNPAVLTSAEVRITKEREQERRRNLEREMRQEMERTAAKANKKAKSRERHKQPPPASASSANQPMLNMLSSLDPVHQQRPGDHDSNKNTSTNGSASGSKTPGGSSRVKKLTHRHSNEALPKSNGKSGRAMASSPPSTAPIATPRRATKAVRSSSSKSNQAEDVPFYPSWGPDGLPWNEDRDRPRPKISKPIPIATPPTSPTRTPAGSLPDTARGHYQPPSQQQPQHYHHRRRSSSLVSTPHSTSTAGSFSFFNPAAPRNSTSTNDTSWSMLSSSEIDAAVAAVSSPLHNHHSGGPPSTVPTRQSYYDMRSKFECRVIHECRPPGGVQYRGLPFFTLEVGDVFDVLKEAGHPSLHQELPLYIEEGDDTLLLLRNGEGMAGWALASFLVPL